MKWTAFSLVFSMVLLGACAPLNHEISRMDKDQLKSLLGDPGVVIVEAVPGDGNSLRIKGAVSGPRDDFKSWADKYPKDQTFVFYCP